jgi:hypothetical protein
MQPPGHKNGADTHGFGAAAGKDRPLDLRKTLASNQHADVVVAQHAAITFIRPGRVGETLVAEAVERTRAGRSGMYDVRVSTAGGDLVAEFRGHTRMLRGTTRTEETDGRT